MNQEVFFFPSPAPDRSVKKGGDTVFWSRKCEPSAKKCERLGIKGMWYDAADHEKSRNACRCPEIHQAVP